MDERVRGIIQVAALLFSSKGIKAVTMTELAQQCGISKKTLYFYFRDKDDLLLTVISQHYKTIRKEVVQFNEQPNVIAGDLNKLFRLIKAQSKVFTPILLADLGKYAYRISLVVDWRFKKLISILIAPDGGRKWYGWQLLQIFRDFSIPEEERQYLLDQINCNYQQWLTACAYSGADKTEHAPRCV